MPQLLGCTDIPVMAHGLTDFFDRPGSPQLEPDASSTLGLGYDYEDCVTVLRRHLVQRLGCNRSIHLTPIPLFLCSLRHVLGP